MFIALVGCNRESYFSSKWNSTEACFQESFPSAWLCKIERRSQIEQLGSTLQKANHQTCLCWNKMLLGGNCPAIPPAPSLLSSANQENASTYSNKLEVIFESESELLELIRLYKWTLQEIASFYILLPLMTCYAIEHLQPRNTWLQQLIMLPWDEIHQG